MASLESINKRNADNQKRIGKAIGKLGAAGVKLPKPPIRHRDSNIQLMKRLEYIADVVEILADEFSEQKRELDQILEQVSEPETEPKKKGNKK